MIITLNQLRGKPIVTSPGLAMRSWQSAQSAITPPVAQVQPQLGTAFDLQVAPGTVGF